MSNSTVIQQGATFDWLQIYYKGDYSTWTPYGQIRKDYAYKNGEVLVDFNFYPLSYGNVTIGEITGNYTLVRPYLSASKTLALPNHKLRTDSDQPLKPGRNCWLYDIKLVAPGGEVKKSTVRFLEVMPDVTRLS